MNKIVRVGIFLALLIAGLLGLAMTMCGGGFLIVVARSLDGGEGGLSSWLPIVGIALGSIAVGSTILFGVWKGFQSSRDEEG